VRKTVESLNKSTYLRQRFEEIQKERRNGRSGKKISNAPYHRWGATEETLEGILSEWEDLSMAFHICDKAAAWERMEEIKTILVEFHSILRPFREVQVLAQSGSKFNLLTALLRLNAAYRKIARGRGNAVTILWPSDPTLHVGNQDDDSEEDDEAPATTERYGDQLHPCTRLVIQKMREGLDGRYFFRYHPVLSLRKPKSLTTLTEANVELSVFKASYLFDIAQLLHPELYSGRFIDSMCQVIEINDSSLTVVGRPSLPTVDVLRSNHAALLKAALWKKIRELALIAARELTYFRSTSSQSPSVVAQSSQETLLMTQEPKSPPRKRRSIATEVGLGSPDSAVSSVVDSPHRRPMSASEQVDDEIQRYKTLGRWWQHGKEARQLVDCNGIEWWGRWGERSKLPCLTKVAFAVFGLLPGSGALECDIGGFKDILAPKRSRLDPAAVEMHLVVRKNKDLTELDPGRLEQLPAAHWERLLPKRPASPVNYHEGEDTENTTRADNVVDLGLSYSFDPNPCL
jgi:hypothetical protein